MNLWAIGAHVFVGMLLHELAHGVVALQLGGDSDALRRRLTLNPLVHVSWLGTLVMPAVLLLVGMPPVGWLKPMPIDSSKFSNPISDMARVAAAGPLSNWTIGVLCYVGYTLGVPYAIEGALVNVCIGLFNALPIPPLDGWYVLRAATGSKTVVTFKTRAGVENYLAWYLTPSIRVGLWDHMDRPEKQHGGFVGLCWLKADLCLSWTVSPHGVQQAGRAPGILSVRGRPLGPSRARVARG